MKTGGKGSSLIFAALEMVSVLSKKAVLVCSTLWCLIRTTQPLSGPVVKHPRVDFCGPCFSLFRPCEFHSDHVFHFNPPVVFIQTVVFKKATSRVLV